MSNCPIYDDPDECPHQGPGCIEHCPPLKRLDDFCGDPSCTLCALDENSSYKGRGSESDPSLPRTRHVRFEEIKRELAELNRVKDEHPEHADLIFHQINVLLDELENSDGNSI